MLIVRVYHRDLTQQNLPHGYFGDTNGDGDNWVVVRYLLQDSRPKQYGQHVDVRA